MLGCSAWKVVSGKYSNHPASFHTIFRVFYTETLNCFELFGVINKCFYFVYTSVVLVYDGYICILYVDVFYLNLRTIYSDKSTMEETGHLTFARFERSNTYRKLNLKHTPKVDETWLPIFSSMCVDG